MQDGVAAIGGWACKALWMAAAMASVAIALFSCRYLLGIGPLSPDILANLFARPWLGVHVAGAATALLVGPVQFLPRMRARWPGLHRWTGRLYVTGCIGGGTAGFVIALGSTAGPVATLGFGSLAIAWVAANVQGWRLAMRRRFAEHRVWMIRSGAMTFAAVTLRLYLALFPLLGLSPVAGYRAAAFSWIPNLILAELYMHVAGRKRAAAGNAPPAAFA